MDNIGNTGNISGMYVEKFVKEYIEDNEEGILEAFKTSKKAIDDRNVKGSNFGLHRNGNYILFNGKGKNVENWMFDVICGEIRDDVCDRIADNFGEESYWDVYWGCCNEVLKEVERVVGEMMESVENKEK